jgi:dephospho-CoA kinase
MIRIALVGDIGSGKTFYAKLFGYPVFNADLIVAEIYKKNKKCFNQIKKKLPNFFSSFPFKKKELINCILANRKNLKKITEVIHPLVKKRMKLFMNKNKTQRCVVLDIPLFLENKLNKKGDVIIYIQSSKKKSVKKLKVRKNYNKKLIERFKQIQLPLKKKKEKSNFIIKNIFHYKRAVKDVKRIIKIII